jgi:translation elongation factor EF-Tu-like GTPase
MPDEVRGGYLLAEVRLLRTDEGGRSDPVSEGYRPQLFIGLTRRGQRVYNDAVWVGLWPDVVAPGERCVVALAPLTPELLVLLGEGSDVAFAEGHREVARGTVLDVRRR